MKILEKERRQPRIISVPEGHLGLVYTSISRGHFDPLNFLHNDLSQIPFNFTSDDRHNFIGYREQDFPPELVPTSNGWYLQGEKTHLWGPMSPPFKLQTLFTLVEYSPAHDGVVKENVSAQVRSGGLSPNLERYALQTGITHSEIQEWRRERRSVENYY